MTYDMKINKPGTYIVKYDVREGEAKRGRPRKDTWMNDRATTIPLFATHSERAAEQNFRYTLAREHGVSEDRVLITAWEPGEIKRPRTVAKRRAPAPGARKTAPGVKKPDATAKLAKARS